MKNARSIVASMTVAAVVAIGCGDTRIASTDAGPPPDAAPTDAGGIDGGNPSFGGLFEFAGNNDAVDVGLPALKGTDLVYSWAQLEPTEGAYQWSLIDNDVQPWSQAGKKVFIRVVTSNPVEDNKASHWNGTAGHATPAWVYTAGAQSITELDASGQTSVLPVYWDPAYQAKYDAFVKAFGARFDGRSDVIAIQMGIAFNGETGLDGLDSPSTKDALWQAAGYTDQNQLNAIVSSVTSYKNAFHKTPLIAMINQKSTFLDEVHADAAVQQADDDAVLSLPVLSGLWLENNGLANSSVLTGAEWSQTIVALEPLHDCKPLGESLISILQNGYSNLHAQYLFAFQIDIQDPAQSDALAWIQTLP